MRVGLERGAVELYEYDPGWQDLFEQEKKELLRAFPDRILEIEHIGSTSIPGMVAKPIIDMNVAVASLDDVADFIEKLPDLGYEYMPERRFNDRHFFPKGSRKRRTHHVNLVEITSVTGWADMLLFRDYLRSHCDAREAYTDLKQDLAGRYANDRDKYTKAKSEFVQKILEHAKTARVSGF